MQVENDEALRQFNQQWDKQHSTEGFKQPIDLGSHANSNSQSLIESINNGGFNVNRTPYTPSVIPTTGNACPECKLLHPPLPPGQKCPNAIASTPPPTIQKKIEPLTEGPTKSEIKTLSTAPQRPIQPPPAPTSNPVLPPASTSTTWNLVEPEPEALADNNIPSEIHINKYLNSWGDLLKVYILNHNVNNVKKLMRHITIEITDFLESYKGK